MIVSTFEKLAINLSFLGCTESRTFEYLDSKTEQKITSSESEVKEGETVGETVGEVNDERSELEEEERYKEKTDELSEEDSGSDIEILSDMKITDNTVSPLGDTKLVFSFDLYIVSEILAHL